MPLELDATPEIAGQTNSLVAIEERVEAGRLPWTGPLLLAGLRPALFFTLQGLLA